MGDLPDRGAGARSARSKRLNVEPSERSADWVREVVAAVNEGDAQRLAHLTGPDVEFHSVFAASEGRVYRGQDGFEQFFQDTEAAFDGFRVDLRGFQQLPGDQLLVEMLMTVRGRASGVPIEQLVWQVWTFKDGRPWRNEAFFARDQALEAAALRE